MPWRNTLSMVINLSVLWSISLSSSLVHFKNGLGYLTREITQAFLPLTRFLLQSLSLRSFLFFWVTPFLLFLSSLFDWWFLLPIFHSSRNFPSLKVFKCFPYLAILFLPLRLFLHFIICVVHLSMPNSIPISCMCLIITLVYKNKFLVWGKNRDRCFLLIWVCWIQIYSFALSPQVFWLLNSLILV